MGLREDDQYLIRNGYAASTASYFAYLDSGDYDRAEERLAEVYTYPRLYREYVHDPSVKRPDRFDIHTGTAFYFNRYNRDENPPPEGVLPYMRRIAEAYPDNYMLKQFYGAVVWRHRDPDEGCRLCSEAYDVYRAVKGEGAPPDIILSLPLRGRIISAVGRDSRKGPSHAGLNRDAVDLCLVDDTGKNISFRAPVYAPCAGTVLEAATHAGGREAYVLIDYGGGVTVYLTHLLPGSLTVQPGATVAAGDPLGVLGLPELPHLHIQAGYEYPHEITLPFVFDRYDTPDGRGVRDSIPAEEEVLYSPAGED